MTTVFVGEPSTQPSTALTLERRPDGRGLDYFLHVNADLKEKGLLLVFNPTPAAVSRSLAAAPQTCSMASVKATRCRAYCCFKSTNGMFNSITLLVCRIT